MRTVITMLSLTLVVMTAATIVWADMGRPLPQPKPSKYVIATGMQIVPDSKTGVARLQISEATLKELNEEVQRGPTSQSFGQRFTGSSINTIAAGLFLFMSIGFGGVWLARSSQRGAKPKALAAILISFATLGTAAIIANANVAPPPAHLWRNLSKNLTAGKTTGGEVNVEIVSEGNGIKLIMPTTRDAGTTTDD